MTGIPSDRYNASTQRAFWLALCSQGLFFVTDTLLGLPRFSSLFPSLELSSTTGTRHSLKISILGLHSAARRSIGCSLRFRRSSRFWAPCGKDTALGGEVGWAKRRYVALEDDPLRPRGLGPLTVHAADGRRRLLHSSVGVHCGRPQLMLTLADEKNVVKLETADGHIDTPSPKDIDETLRSLDGHHNNFVILGCDEMTYMQTSGSSDMGFILEYQEGSLDEHYRATDDSIPLDQVARAFEMYLHGDETWKPLFEWRKEDLSVQRGCRRATVMVAMCLVLVIISSVWRLVV